MSAKRFFFVCMMHVAVGAFQLGWAELLSVDLGGCAPTDFVCSTPLEGLLAIIRIQPTFSIGFAVSLIGNILGMVWGVLSFNYALLSGDSVSTALIGYVFRLGLGLIGLEIMFNASGNLLQALRG